MAILSRVEQRFENDCSVAAVSTVMGPPYTYERVLADNPHYATISETGMYFAWWEKYLWDAGFPNRYYPISCLHFTKRPDIVGLLMLCPTKGKIGHVVAVDELGVINPALHWPERLRDVCELLKEYHRITGFVPYTLEGEFLAVWRT